MAWCPVAVPGFCRGKLAVAVVTGSTANSSRPTTMETGHSAALARMTGAGVPALTAASLGEVELPLPGPAELRHLTMLIETTEQAYGAAMEAAHLRRTLYRDAIVARLLARPAHGESE